MTRRSYTVIPDWMLDLGLDIWETVILAVIFGFCQDGESSFTGSWSYLQRKACCSRRKVKNALDHLVELGYIRKKDVYTDGVHFCQYRFVWGGASGARVVHDVHGGGAPGAHNNLKKDKDKSLLIDDDARTREGEVFDFGKAVVALGVPEGVVADWMQIRAAKRADNSRTAFDGLVREIEKSGATAEDCVRFSVENGWRGFKARWLQEELAKESAPRTEAQRPVYQPQRRQESLVEHWARVDREIEEILPGYGKQRTDNQ
jgi:hypothetical protein